MSLDPLFACAGSWSGTSTLTDPENGIDEASPSRVRVAPLIRGRFVRMDYDWSYRGERQEGSLLLGFDPKRGVCTAHWADTWHMGYGVMACEGSPEPCGLSVRGSYSVPGHPDWGWRIDLSAEEGRALRIRMFNVSPEGHEELAVNGEYSRA